VVLEERVGDLTPHFAKPSARKFTPEVRRSLSQILAQHPHRSLLWLAQQLEGGWGRTFSASGVRNVLHSMGHRHSVPNHTSLTPENKLVRLSWANDNSGNDWKRIWSFDESYFCLDPSSGKV
jgi:hypothetical protein